MRPEDAIQIIHHAVRCRESCCSAYSSDTDGRLRTVRRKHSVKRLSVASTRVYPPSWLFPPRRGHEQSVPCLQTNRLNEEFRCNSKEEVVFAVVLEDCFAIKGDYRLRV